VDIKKMLTICERTAASIEGANNVLNPMIVAVDNDHKRLSKKLCKNIKEIIND